MWHSIIKLRAIFLIFLSPLIILWGTTLHAATVSGQLAKWQPVTLDFVGPLLDETSDSPNPFLDYRLTVNLTSPSGQVSSIPGFFAGDGSGGSLGQVWRARFSADEVGRWSYQASMRLGSGVAVSLDSNAGSNVNLQGASGQFNISGIPANALGFLQYGRLEYVGGHYMKFRDGPYWIKGGTDSPENLLGFAGIDGTVDQGGNETNFLHTFEQHRSDWQTGDPLFSNSSTGVDSRGIIGALNYLNSQGVNSVYFLPMNLGGDGQETFPFVGANNNRYDKTHYDISKLYQWNEVLAHAQEKSVALNIVLSETEQANERWLDNGALGVERKLFFRELIARFGYLLAVKWNLGEENDYPLVELQKHADYIQALDWSNKPIAVHTHINQFFRYGELVGDPRFSASSIQYDPQFAGQFVEQWRSNSAAAGHPWILDMDENTNGLGSEGADERRKQILYDVYFSGGQIEWYFGSQPLPLGGDTTAGNFRLREPMWQQMRIARQMMESQLPFWNMQPADSLVQGDSGAYGGAEVFASKGEIYAIYLPETTGNETLDVSGTNVMYRQRWFNPRTGEMINGRENLASSGALSLGSPPSQAGQDWVTLISRTDGTTTPVVTPVITPVVDNTAPRFASIPSPTVEVGETFSVTLTATDADGTFPAVSVTSVPQGMRISSQGNGQLRLDWTVPSNAAAQSLVGLIAIDAVDQSLVTRQNMTINVNQNVVDNTPDPVTGGDEFGFGDLPQVVVSAGDMLNLSLQATHPSGRFPSVTVASLPRGMKINGPGRGVLELSWQVPSDVAQESIVQLVTIDPFDNTRRVTQNLVIRSSDANGDTQNPQTGPPDSDANAPAFVSISEQTVSVGQQLSVVVRATDADGVPPAMVIRNLPTGASFDDNGNGTRTFRWRPGVSDTGRQVFSLLATDHAVRSLTDSMDLVVIVQP